MAGWQSTKTVIYNTIHRNKKSVEQLADETGISAAYLYRAGLPISKSGVKLPVDYLVSLMKAANNYSILRHLATLCGFVLVKIPRFRASKGDQNLILSEYNKTTTDAASKMIKFFENPQSGDNYKALINSLDKVLEKAVGAQKFANKEFSGQLDMDL